jgi:hypothetical protein
MNTLYILFNLLKNYSINVCNLTHFIKEIVPKLFNNTLLFDIFDIMNYTIVGNNKQHNDKSFGRYVNKEIDLLKQYKSIQ